MKERQRTVCRVTLLVVLLLASGAGSRVLPFQSSRHKVSLQLRNVSIQDVLKTLAVEGKLNIVASKDVKGQVTIFVDSLSVMEALGVVVEAQGLAYYVDRGVVRVVTAQEYKKRFGKDFRDRTQTRIVKLNYASAEQAVKSIFQLKSKEGKVIADQRSNSLILVDRPATLRDMEATIKEIDVPLLIRTFSLAHVPVQSVEEVVKSIVSSGGKVRADVETNRLLVVDTAERLDRVAKFVSEADVPGATVTEIFSLQYSEADKIAARIKGELTPGVGLAVADEATNKLFVRDLPDNLTYIRQLIQALDQRTKEVLIEAKIIQIALSDNFKMGVDWQAMTSRLGGVIDAGSSFRVLSDSEQGGRVRATGISSGPNSLNGLLEILQTMGKTDLLSKPRITCLDGEEAYILVGSTVPYKTIDTREDQGVLKTFEKVVMVEVGVKLNVTPKINDDGFITMKIRPEVSQVTSFIDNLPVIEKSESETTVIVKDGVTIIIGGLIKDQDVINESRIPLLGSIPILGIPFRSKSRSRVKTELVILLRPQIITGGDEFKGDKG